MTERFQYINHIADLVALELTGKISGEEQQELECWKKESPEHMHLYEKYQSEIFVARKFEFVKEHDLREAYQVFVERTYRIMRRRRRIMFYRYVGVILLLFTIGSIVFLTREREKVPVFLAQKIMPGSCKAVLTHPDGLKVDISNTSYLDYITNKSLSVVAREEEKIDTLPLRYYTITIPRGGEYSLTLSDGSILTMNSESEIRIPEYFDHAQRNVYMSGEIYFEIARDTVVPFIVHTDRGDIKVLGTSFNVRDYQDETFLETTLVSGKIAFNQAGKEVYLKPSEQLRLNKESGETTVEVVDVRLYCSWKEGRFIFEKERLENIMNTISRWYNINVSYEDQAVKDILFTGNIKRYGDLKQVIEMLKLINKIDIEVKGNDVFIKDCQ